MQSTAWGTSLRAEGPIGEKACSSDAEQHEWHSLMHLVMQGRAQQQLESPYSQMPMIVLCMHGARRDNLKVHNSFLKQPLSCTPLSSEAVCSSMQEACTYLPHHPTPRLQGEALLC